MTDCGEALKFAASDDFSLRTLRPVNKVTELITAADCAVLTGMPQSVLVKKLVATTELLQIVELGGRATSGHIPSRIPQESTEQQLSKREAAQL